ncbi:MAG: VOC family protein [Planctomycetia bacterium]
MHRNPVGWFEIYVQDMARAKKFYEAVLRVDLSALEAPPEAQIEMLAFPMEMNVPGSAGALVKMEGFPSGGNSVMVYFHCADCAVEAGRVEAAGGRVQQEKMSIGAYGFCAMALDSEGNMFGLHSMA